MNATAAATHSTSAPQPDAPTAVVPLSLPWPIFLVGMMGAGKTTLGRRLAQALGRRFIDLDHELEARCGVRIATIFDIEGETGFRDREAALLDVCTREANTVLATGGGAVLRAGDQIAFSPRHRFLVESPQTSPSVPSAPSAAMMQPLLLPSFSARPLRPLIWLLAAAVLLAAVLAGVLLLGPA